ncbi:MAG TPA: hypothetical protein VFQ44_20750 [Streptosporangiaceae bacterium]|nr:hypothetical protein [Streptosporangiaceae bacterium]
MCKLSATGTPPPAPTTSSAGVGQEQRRFAEAEAAYRQALDIYLESDPRRASGTGTRLGITLAELGRHSEAAAVLLTATVTWRQETRYRDPNNLPLLRHQRDRLETPEFTALINENVPAELREQLTAATESS